MILGGLARVCAACSRLRVPPHVDLLGPSGMALAFYPRRGELGDDESQMHDSILIANGGSHLLGAAQISPYHLCEPVELSGCPFV